MAVVTAVLPVLLQAVQDGPSEKGSPGLHAPFPGQRAQLIHTQVEAHQVPLHLLQKRCEEEGEIEGDERGSEGWREVGGIYYMGYFLLM